MKISEKEYFKFRDGKIIKIMPTSSCGIIENVDGDYIFFWLSDYSTLKRTEIINDKVKYSHIDQHSDGRIWANVVVHED